MQQIIGDWQRAQERRGLVRETASGRARKVTRFNAWTGNIVYAADADDIEAFLDLRRTAAGDPIGAKTRYTWISALGCFYDWSIRRGLTDTNPTLLVDRPKLPTNLPRPIPDADLAFAVAAAIGQVKVWLLLASRGGLRCAEIANLRRDDLLWDLNRIRVNGKGAKQRLVPMHPLVRAALEAQPTAGGKNGYVFTRPMGSRWTAADVSRIGVAHFRTLNIDATMHQLRHWFATRALRECKNIRTVQTLLGHADPKTTAIYTAFCDDEAEAVVMAL